MHKKYYLVFQIISILFFTSQLVYSQWTSMGLSGKLAGQEISVIDVHPFYPELVLIATKTGGLWITTNGGENLAQSTLGFSYYPNVGIQRICRAPSNPDIVYLVNDNLDYQTTASGGIFKSTDGGINWTRLNSFERRSLFGLTVHPHDSNILFITVKGTNATEDGGIWKSEDGGMTFSRKLEFPDPLPFVSTILYDNSNPEHLVAATNREIINLVSYDGGENWTPNYNTSVFDSDKLWEMVIKEDDGSYVLAAGEFTGIKRSEDGGANWFESGFDWITVAKLNRVPGEPDKVYCGTGDGEIYYSEDFGLSWSSNPVPLPSGILSGGPFAWDETSDRRMYVAVSPTDVYYRSYATDNSVAAPTNLQANGNNPSSWQQGQDFTLTWNNPSDPSGIIAAYLKMDKPPSSMTDFDYSTQNTSYNIAATQENSQMVYVWLEDGAGNNGYANPASVELRYDATAPVLSNIRISTPDYPTSWFNQETNSTVTVYVQYNETNAASATLTSDDLTTPLVNTNLNSGNAQVTTFTIDISGKPDGNYALTIDLFDQAKSYDSRTLYIYLDNTAPTVLASSPDTSTSSSFTVSWENGSDGSGSGLSGEYDVRVKVDGSNWVDWKTKISATSALYPGEHGHRYAFEAVAWDNVGNRTDFTGTEQSVTVVDTVADDISAPAAPTDLLANGANPSPWQNKSSFTLTWTNPYDPSGLFRCLYKLGAEPTSNYDTTATASPNSPISVTVTQEYGQGIYIWLQDNRGNVNYLNHTNVNLRYDATPPSGTVASSPESSSSLSFTVSWEGANDGAGSGLASKYDVRVKMDDQDWSDWKTEFSGLSDTFVGNQGHTYYFEAAAWDNVGNRELFTGTAETATAVDTIKADTQAPQHPINLMANGTSPSPWQQSQVFNITWTNPSDPSGIERTLYKLGAEPNSNYDTTATASANSALSVVATQEFGQMLYVWLEDGLGNVNYLNFATVNLRYDATPPTGTQATSPDTSSSLSFTVSWMGASDGVGSGLIGEYDVKVKQDNGSWTDWKTKINGLNDTFTGEQGHTYYFEAAARDSVDNLEAFTGIAETATIVDTLQSDLQAPQAPINLLSNGANPSPWQQSNVFSVTWTNPDDPSGIKHTLYKLGAEPTSNFDISATASANPPLSVVATQEFGQMVYVWLEDGLGNVNYQNFASINLRYDATPPTSTEASSPESSSSLSFTVSWGGSSDGNGSGLSGKYDVRVKQNDGNWSDWKTASTGFSDIFTGQQGNTYYFEAAAWDNVGNREIFTGTPETGTVIDTLALDTQAPQAPINLSANEHNPSIWQQHNVFSIRWTNPSDPSGIVRTFYKLGSEPTTNYDTTATTSAIPPLGISATKEFGQMLYVWLEDGLGNVNYQNFASINLRYDTASPIGTLAFSPDTSSSLSFTVIWGNGSDSPGSGLSGEYDVRVRIDDRDWLEWRTKFTETSGTYTGQHGRTYYFEAAAWDSAGNRELFTETPETATYVDTTTDVSPDTRSIQIIQLNTSWEVGSTQNINWSTTGDIQNVKIEILRYGTTRELLIETQNTGSWQWQVTNPTSNNCYLWITDAADNSVAAQTKTPFVIIPEYSSGLTNPNQQPAGEIAAAYRLLSVPLELNSSLVKNVLNELGDYDNTKWRLFDWQNNDWLEYQNTMEFYPGKSYFLIIKQPNIQIATGSGFLVGYPEFKLFIRNGWNLIANPYNFDLPKTQLALASGKQVRDLWTYAPVNQTGWVQPETVKPWEGYAIYSNVSDTLIFRPDWKSIQKIKPAVTTGIDWAIQISARNETCGDLINFCGVAANSEPEYDEHDLREPPVIGDYISLYFPHSDWSKFLGRYAADFQPAGKSGYSWNFVVETSLPQKMIQLEFDNIEHVPENLQIKLVDSQSGISIDLRKQTHYQYLSNEKSAPRTFQLLVGESEALDQFESIPVSFKLFQNFPNPFNAQTKIRYSIPNPAHVNIRIYNLQGELITELLNQHLQIAGYHTITWDGKDQSTEFVASGIYILKITTKGFTEVKKLIYLK